MRVCPRCGFETDAAVCPHDGATTVTVSTAVATYPHGTVIDDRYRIEEVLGIGGFGAVYKCTQLTMDQHIAVKVLKHEHIKSEEHVKRFAREAQAASKLSHPNTIRIFDFGSHTDDALFLAMEYLEGRTLAQRLDAEHRLPAEQVAHILTQICHSLTEAHINGIIHRDLKPENIMLLKVAGDPNFVKVLDFGIAAKLADADERDEKLTEIGMIMGTPTYMSPEQAHGKPLDARCDIYALGVLMYEMLTGRVPFEGDQPMTVLVKHINDPAVPPREFAPDADIPVAIEKVVLRCLEKEPVLRPQTCAELAEMLTKAAANPDSGLTRGRVPAQQPVHVRTQGYSLGGELTEPVREMTPAGQDSLVTQVVSPQRRTATGYSSSRGGSKTPLWLGLGALGIVGAAAVALALLVPGTPSTPVKEDTSRKPHSEASMKAGNGATTTKAAAAAQAEQARKTKAAAKKAADDAARIVQEAADKAAAAATARIEAEAKARRAAEEKARLLARKAAKTAAGQRAGTQAKPTTPAKPAKVATTDAAAVAARAEAKAKTRAAAKAAAARKAAKENAVTRDHFRLPGKGATSPK